MRKFIIILLAILFAFSAAAESDMAGLTTEDLITLRDALNHGNRLVMMKDGRIILDISGDEKKKLTVEDLLEKFNVASGEEFANDRMILG